MKLSPYLLFTGNCTEAMSFYKDCFGGDLKITLVKDSPMKDKLARDNQNKVVHANLKSNDIDIFASDWLHPTRHPLQGNTVCLYISQIDFKTLQNIFEKLSVDATNVDQLEKQFFGTYGALTDKFGVRWMFQGNPENV